MVFVDTTTLLAWARDPAAAFDGETARRAGALMSRLERGGTDVAVATASVVTFLNAVPKQEQQLQVAVLEQALIIFPFDAPAKAHAERLYNNAAPSLKGYRREAEKLKAHLRIVAPALHRGVETFYSPDPDLRRLAAAGGLATADLPSPALSRERPAAR